MVRHLLIAVAAASCCVPLPALAQQPPAPAATARCGGVLCDLYYAGKPAPVPGQPEAPDPTRLPCHDFLCAAFGGRTPDAQPAVAQAQPELAPEPAKPAERKHRKRKVAASTATRKADAAQ